MQTLFEELLVRNKQEETLPYLYRACTNRCLNLLRDAKRRAELLRAEMPSLDAAPQTRLEDRIVGLGLLSSLVARLDKKSSEILVYRYLDDLGQEEIATLMRLSRRTVGKRLQQIATEARKLAASAAETGGRSK